MNASSPQHGPGHRRYSFGAFTLDVDRGTLLGAGKELPLRPKSFEVLTYLVEHPGRVVTRDELMNAVWGEVVVTEDSLTQCLIDIRKATSDASRQIIRTVPRRGYLFDLPVDVAPAPEPPVPARTRARRMLWPVGAALLVGAGALSWWIAGTRSPMESGPALGPDSIAVLPFVDMSRAQDHAYFGDGIAEEILNVLAQSPELRVVARTSSFSFREHTPDVPTIGAKLGVAHVLEGSVRRSGNHVRITAQLVDARTSAHLWSRTYDRELGDLLAVQSDIATAVAQALEVRLADEAPAAKPPLDARAYTHFLQANFFYNRRAPGDVERARSHYQQAVDIEPAFARAWAGLAGAWLVLMSTGTVTPAAGGAGMREAIEQALALEPQLAEAQIRAAQYQSWFGDRQAAREHARRIAQQQPDNVLAVSVLAGLELSQGRLSQAIELQQHAVELDPLGFVQRINLASYLQTARRFDEARTQFVRARELNEAEAPGIDVELGFILILEGRFEDALAAIQDWPDGPDRDQGLALVYGELGRDEDAAAAVERLEQSPGMDADIRIAQVWAYRGEAEAAFQRLETAAGEIRRDYPTLRTEQLLDRIVISPFLRPLHDDPRWQQWFVAIL